MKPLIALTGDEQIIQDVPRLAASRSYFRAVERTGGLPVAVDLLPGLAQDVAKRMDGLLLTGGGDIASSLFGQEPHPMAATPSPARDETELALTRAFLGAKKPILAICRGVQVLAVALGGAIYQHIPEEPGTQVDHDNALTRHPVALSAGSRLRAIYGREEIMANSTHHQAVSQTPDGFAVTARSGDGIIEGMEGLTAVGVQWHPEGLLGAGHDALFRAFVEAASGRPSPFLHNLT